MYVVDRIDTYSNPLYANLTMKTFRNNKGVSLVNASLELYVNMTKMMVKFLIDFNLYTASFSNTFFIFQILISVATPKDESDKEYSTEFFKTTIAKCKLANGVFSNYFVKAFMVNFVNAADFTFKCSSPRGNYSLKNYQVDDGFFPPMLNKMKLLVTCRHNAKIPNVKALQHVFSWKSYGEIRNS